MKKYFSITFLFITVILFSCGEKKPQKQSQPEVKRPVLPEFNADSAYAYVKAQCDFGPRVPNTPAHVACGDYLIGKMKEWSDTVYVQSGIVNAYDGTKLKFRNIIASFNPSNKRRILLFAHWDTRPWADQDKVNPEQPPLGADDGASGVGILMEIARQLQKSKPGIGIDIAFFDAEDYGMKGGGQGSEDS